MKICRKRPEPVSLTKYREAQSDGTWEEMRDDPFHGGQQAYKDIKTTLVKGQRCLCAFCEINIADGTDDESIEAKKHLQRVEHFHPKEDNDGPLNWALHWPNLWVLCHGGSNRTPADPDRYLEPLPANLSCDAYKDHQIKTGKLHEKPEGWLLAPDEVLAFPNLFQFAPDGTPEPHLKNCAEQILPNNRYPDTATLVSKTIEHLNLGCVRLNRSRCIAKARLEKLITKTRQQTPGASPQEAVTNLARRLFPNDVDSPWPKFFTLVRWRLGEPAEIHLRSIQYIG